MITKLTVLYVQVITEWNNGWRIEGIIDPLQGHSCAAVLRDANPR
jgi:hypothetical protein